MVAVSWEGVPPPRRKRIATLSTASALLEGGLRRLAGGSLNSGVEGVPNFTSLRRKGDGLLISSGDPPVILGDLLEENAGFGSSIESCSVLVRFCHWRHSNCPHCYFNLTLLGQTNFSKIDNPVEPSDAMASRIIDHRPRNRVKIQ